MEQRRIGKKKKKREEKYLKKKRGKKILFQGAYSLVFDLEVEMPGKPVVEQRLLNIARCLELEGKGKQSQYRSVTAASFV